MEERTLESKQIYSGRVVDLHVATVELPDGERTQREIIHHAGAVAMVPITDDGEVVLVRQYRSGAQKPLLELPAGGLEPDEDIESCAQRELQEEAGFYPEELIRLGGFYVAASYTTEYITIYLARNLRPAALHGDMDEFIEVVTMPFAEALRMAQTNQIEDSKTIIGLTWAAAHL